MAWLVAPFSSNERRASAFGLLRASVVASEASELGLLEVHEGTPALGASLCDELQGPIEIGRTRGL